MDIGAVINRARDIYANDSIIIPEHCGVLEEGDGYWVEVYVRVTKDSNTEELRSITT